MYPNCTIKAPFFEIGPKSDVYKRQSTARPQCYPHPAQAMRSLHRLTTRLHSIFRHCSEFFR